MKDSVDAQLQTNRQDSVRIGRVQTKSKLYRSLWNNRLNGTHHSTSASLTTKRHLIAWTEPHYGNFFDTTAYLRI
ncbi:unnamed protein product [Schistosoma curassoni]|uniref:Uncharacterized protein n=1 Tax=Schistosoma curassoni TaxID=6186 RepID=A0A183KCC9_9TREM|nr:unnamed protein product [Schistosoma curassoni]